MSMTGTSANVEMAAAQITFNGVDLGFTEGGVTITYGQTYTIWQPDQTTMPEKAFLIGETVTAVVPIAEYTIANLLVAMPSGTLETDSGTPANKVLYLGGGSITDSLLYELIITPVICGSLELDTDPNLKATIWKALSTSPVDTVFARESTRVIPVTFIGFRDSSKSAGKQLVAYGDTTVTP